MVVTYENLDQITIPPSRYLLCTICPFAVSKKLYQLRKECLQNEIEILNCGNQLKRFERDKIRREALALEEDLSMPQKLNEKEILVYKKQCEILTTSFEIQEKNEKIVHLDLKKLTKEVNNDVFEKVKATLTKRLTTISRKKAILRNNKVN